MDDCDHVGYHLSFFSQKELMEVAGEELFHGLGYGKLSHSSGKKDPPTATLIAIKN